MTPALVTIDRKFSSKYRIVASAALKNRNNKQPMNGNFFSRYALALGLGVVILTPVLWAWPTIVLVDKQGIIRYSHIGEGAYDKTESVIKQLLAEKH